MDVRDRLTAVLALHPHQPAAGFPAHCRCHYNPTGGVWAAHVADVLLGHFDIRDTAG